MSLYLSWLCFRPHLPCHRLLLPHLLLALASSWRQPLYLLVLTPYHYRIPKSAFASRVHTLHKKISDVIEQNNIDYKLWIDIRKKYKIFNVNYVIIQIHPKRFPSKCAKKLHACSAGPFNILNKLNDNTYIIYLPKDFDINCTYNVNDLVGYKGLDFNPSNSLVDKPSPEPFYESPHYLHS